MGTTKRPESETSVAVVAAPGATRVLVVDDNTLVRRMAAGALRVAGYDVAEAGDGAEALASFRKEPAQVVITDIGMPRLGGLELLAELRRHESQPEVILLTGSHASDAEAAVQALRLGAHDYIVKDSGAAAALALAVERAAEKWHLRNENARLLDELARLSLTDGLTGVANRRAFDQALFQEVARTQRYGARLCLVLFDLDHFKKVNDTHGHAVGDVVLLEFAQRLSAAARDSDRVFRYGGEEFAVLATDTGEDGALALAQRVVDRMATSPIAAGPLQLRVTCSAGVAELNLRNATGSALVGCADGALYDAKRRGRNRVAAAGGEPLISAATAAAERASLLEGVC